MKSLLPFLSGLFLTAVATGGSPSAQEVLDGSYWCSSDGSQTVTVDVTDTPDPGVDVTFIDSTGFTSPVAGTPGANSTTTNPSTSSSPASGSTTGGGGPYRVRNGKVQKKNADGTWSTWRKKKKPKANGGGSMYLQAGQPAPSDGWLHPGDGRSIHLFQGESWPEAGYFSPGEDVVSLPH